MARQNSPSTSRLIPPTEVPRPTLPPVLELVHSNDRPAKKLTPKSPRKAKAAPAQTEWYECEDLTLPSVSSF